MNGEHVFTERILRFDWFSSRKKEKKTIIDQKVRKSSFSGMAKSKIFVNFGKKWSFYTSGKWKHKKSEKKQKKNDVFFFIVLELRTWKNSVFFTFFFGVIWTLVIIEKNPKNAKKIAD